jgi:hypothetical protein
MINNEQGAVLPEITEIDDSESLPDENSGIAVQSFIKIFDPESGKILIQSRA